MRSDRSGKSSFLEKGRKKEKETKSKRERERERDRRRKRAAERRKIARCGVRLIKYHEELGTKIATRMVEK